MSEYISLQDGIYAALCKMAEAEAGEVKKIVMKCREAARDRTLRLAPAHQDLLCRYGLSRWISGWEDWMYEPVIETIIDMVDDSGERISIRHVRGKAFPSPGIAIGFDDFIKCRGGGDHNRLRTERFAHPEVLRKGDILSDGCRLLSDPRQGANSEVLLHLPGGLLGCWISVAPRIPIALLTPEDNAPLELIED